MAHVHRNKTINIELYQQDLLNLCLLKFLDGVSYIRLIVDRYGPPALKLSKATSSAVRDTRTSNFHSVHQLEDRNE